MFEKSTRHFTNSTGKERSRKLTNQWFIKTQKNGEKVVREWLIYSQSKGSIYCFVCKLFAYSSTSSFVQDPGFSNWKHPELLVSHENSKDHYSAMHLYIQKRKDLSQIATKFDQQNALQLSYWKEVLKRVVSVIRFLSSLGLAFRGADHKIGSQKNGNFLGSLELIAEYDPFLKLHLEKYGNPGKGKVSYLSTSTCEEFVAALGSSVLKQILLELNTSKYFSLSVDSTPDLCHVDQLTFTVRYLLNNEPVERFIEFIPIRGHTAEYLTGVVFDLLKKNTIKVEDCRGQSYDNASNMSGHYSGLQTRFKEVNKYADYVPCTGHSLNLVGLKAAECCLPCVNFFSIVQRLYTFFAASTHRWGVLTNRLQPRKLVVVKRLIDTRWSAHKDATQAVSEASSEIKMALQDIASDSTEEKKTIAEANGLIKKMESLEFALLSILWNDVLTRFNSVSKSVQATDANLSTVTTLISSLKSFVQSLRDDFDRYEKEAKKIAPDVTFADEQHRRRPRSTRITDNEGNAEDTILEGRNKFRIEVYIPILDSLAAGLQQRSVAYDNINSRFSFIEKLPDLTVSQIKEHCELTSAYYDKDLDENEMYLECIQFSNYVAEELERKHLEESKVLDAEKDKDRQLSPKSILANLYTKIKTENLLSSFPNIEILLRIFLCMMVTNCTGERSFSKLKLIKNELRTSMVQQRLNWLSLLSIESELLDLIDVEAIIDDFADKKCRKVFI